MMTGRMAECGGGVDPSECPNIDATDKVGCPGVVTCCRGQSGMVGSIQVSVQNPATAANIYANRNSRVQAISNNLPSVPAPRGG
jgi:hypothetical protein